MTKFVVIKFREIASFARDTTPYTSDCINREAIGQLMRTI